MKLIGIGQVVLSMECSIMWILLTKEDNLLCLQKKVSGFLNSQGLRSYLLERMFKLIWKTLYWIMRSENQK